MDPTDATLACAYRCAAERLISRVVRNLHVSDAYVFDFACMFADENHEGPYWVSHAARVLMDMGRFDISDVLLSVMSSHCARCEPFDW